MLRQCDEEPGLHPRSQVAVMMGDFLLSHWDSSHNKRYHFVGSLVNRLASSSCAWAIN